MKESSTVVGCDVHKEKITAGSATTCSGTSDGDCDRREFTRKQLRFREALGASRPPPLFMRPARVVMSTARPLVDPEVGLRQFTGILGGHDCLCGSARDNHRSPPLGLNMGTNLSVLYRNLCWRDRMWAWPGWRRSS
jgi:hypothetical protein